MLLGLYIHRYLIVEELRCVCICEANLLGDLGEGLARGLLCGKQRVDQDEFACTKSNFCDPRSPGAPIWTTFEDNKLPPASVGAGELGCVLMAETWTAAAFTGRAQATCSRACA